MNEMSEPWPTLWPNFQQGDTFFDLKDTQGQTNPKKVIIPLLREDKSNLPVYGSTPHLHHFALTPWGYGGMLPFNDLPGLFLLILVVKTLEQA